MRIASGVTDQYIYFVAVDSTDYVTRETGLSSFTVYRSRNGGVAAAMTTPTINETDTTNMPGVYELLLDEDMTIDSGDDTQEMVFHITQASMAPVSRTIELYRPKITAGNTLDVTATGAGGIDWGNIENPTTAVDLSGTDIQLVDTTTTNTDMRGTDNAALATALSTAQTDLDTLTGTDGVTLATSQPNYAPNTTTPPTAAAVADAVWDEPKADHTGVTTFGDLATDLDTAIVNIAALNDVSVADILTTQMTEAYAADGVAPTIAQALHLIQQHLTEFAISGTTYTTKKLDGATSAATFTLDDASNPTSSTRAT